MARDRKRRWKRWVEVQIDLDATELCHIARSCGMQVIAAVRPGLCVWGSLGLFGTPEQMAATEAIWQRMGCRSSSRRPRGAEEVWTGRDPINWCEVTCDWAKLFVERPVRRCANCGGSGQILGGDSMGSYMRACSCKAMSEADS